MAVTINLRNDSGARLVRSLSRALQERNWQPVVERSAANSIKNHLAGLDTSKANRRNWPRTHFFAKCARSVSSQSSPGNVKISIAQVGFRLALEGGVVRPGRNPSSATGRPTQWLTIPARSEAAGKRAVEFGNLKFRKFRDDLAGLIAGEGGADVGKGRRIGKAARNALRRANQEGVVMFWLVKSTTHRPDPSILPTERALVADIARGLDSYFAAIRDRATVGGEA